MWHRIRLEVSVAAAVAIAIAALVLALRGDGSDPAVVADGADGPGPAAAANVVPKGAEEVTITGFAYYPEPIRVKAGAPIAWTNIDGGVPHTVTARDGSWDSGTLEMGQIFSKTFDDPGTYVYICTLHPPTSAAFFGAPEGTKLAGGGGHGMKGTIVVE